MLICIFVSHDCIIPFQLRHKLITVSLVLRAFRIPPYGFVIKNIPEPLSKPFLPAGIFMPLPNRSD